LNVIDFALKCAFSYDRKTRIIKILKQTKKRQYITECSIKTADGTSLGTIVHFGIDYKTIRSR